MLGFEIQPGLKVSPDITPQYTKASNNNKSLRKPFDLRPSTSVFPVLPEGPFLAFSGIILALFGAIGFRICLDINATWPQFFGSLAIAVFGVVVFHIGLIWWLR